MVFLKSNSRIFALAVLGAMVLSYSCGNRQKAEQHDDGQLAVERYSCSDSAAYAYLKMEVELPVADEGVAGNMRRELTAILDDRLTRVTSFEEGQSFPSYEGLTDDMPSMMGYYKKELMSLLANLSQSDADERKRYIEKDLEISDEEKAREIANMPKWEYDYALKKIADTLNYVVFLSQGYIYMGGAHGGVSGDGCLTFSKADGSLVRQFVDTTRVADLQPLFVEGLLQYFADNNQSLTRDELLDQLFIDKDANGQKTIPLPVQQPYPSKDGLVFTYNQYEIAAYACGMPCFVIAYDKIAPFLTEEAKHLIF
jgi:hypothetical protein